jgi:hypothetical protein
MERANDTPSLQRSICEPFARILKGEVKAKECQFLFSIVENMDSHFSTTDLF